MTGDRAILAIGEERIEEAQEEIALKVLWAGLVEVR